jgi:hypothetical protein
MRTDSAKPAAKLFSQIELSIGAGDGNRTHVCSLGSYRSTIELHPQRAVYTVQPRSLESYRLAVLALAAGFLTAFGFAAAAFLAALGLSVSGFFTAGFALAGFSVASTFSDLAASMYIK